MKARTVAAIIRHFEWVSMKLGQASGYYFRSEEYQCCPFCGGLKPGDAEREFVPEAIGHRDDCKLALLLRDYPEAL